MRIVFFGSADFAVPSLDLLLKNNFQISAVVTAPDKPAGRGQKLHTTPVKDFAINNNLKILQPINLKSPDFINELQKLNANLFIVIAFRILPEVVWTIPPLGTFNLHASLLPQYRGPAPINWAIINGENITGLTTFMLDENVDTGKILFQEQIIINQNESAGELYNRMKILGAPLVIKSVKAITDNSVKPASQIITSSALIKAPKIFKDTCRIDWKKNAESIHNLIRGLAPSPAAFSELSSSSNSEKIYIKIYNSDFENNQSSSPGEIITDNKSFLKIAANDGFVFINELQLTGKKRLPIKEFLKGFKFTPSHFLC